MRSAICRRGSPLAVAGSVAALLFAGCQAYQTRQQLRQSEKQSKQTERELKESRRALRSSTSVAINEEEREVNRLVTPDLWPYFKLGRELPNADNNLTRRAFVVAGAFLDHFEHLRFQEATGAYPADAAAWGSYIRWSFLSAPVLCEELASAASFYGTTTDTVWSRWAWAVCATPTVRGWPIGRLPPLGCGMK